MSHAAPPGPDSDASLKARLREELRKYLIASAYLYVCFGALQFYKAALLFDAGVHYVPLGVALVKALIVGKFLLLGESMRVGTRLRSRRLLGRIVQRVLLLLVLVVVLTIAEELLVGWIHGHAIAGIEADFNARSMPELLAEMVLMGLILLPLVVTTEMNHALGPGKLRRMLLTAQDTGHEAV